MSHYDRHVFFCTNQRAAGEACCNDHQSEQMRSYAKDKVKTLRGEVKDHVRVNSAGCLGRCDSGPVMVIYPEAVWYSYRTKADIDEIIMRHLGQGDVVERLKI